ncbi:MIF4G domain-containing protein [Entamoeba marina]
MALEEKPEQPLEVPFSLENNFTLTGWYNPQFLSFGTNSNNNFIDIVIQDKLFDIIQVLHSDANLLLSYSQCCAPSEFIDFETITKAIFSVFLSGVQSHSYLYYTVLSRMVLFLEPTFKPITLTEIYLMNHLDELCGSSIIRFVHYLSNKYINLNYEFKEQIWKIYEESYKDNEIYKFFFTSFFSNLSLFDIRKTEADVSSPTLRQFIKEVAFNCPDIYGDIRRIKEDFEISVTNNESAEDIFESLASSYDETNIEKVSLYIALEKSEQSVSKLDEFITRFKSWLEKWISSGSNAIECCNIIFSAWQNSPIDLMIVFKRFVYHQLLDRSIVIDYILEKIKLPDLNIHYIDLLIELCNCDCPNSSDIKMKVITELVGCIAPLDNGQTQKQILEGFLVYFVQSMSHIKNELITFPTPAFDIHQQIYSDLIQMNIK